MIVEEAVWKCRMYSLSQYLRFPFVYKGEDMDGLSRLQTFYELPRSFAILGIELSLHFKFKYAVTKSPLQVSLNCTKTALIAHRQRHRESMEVTHRVVTEDR